MKHTGLTWEEVSQYEEVKGYGQQIWKYKRRKNVIRYRFLCGK